MGKLNINCPHFSVCSGCVFNINVDQPEILTDTRTFFDSVGVNKIDFHFGSPIGWRTRAKVAVRGSVQNPVIGLFKKGSHQVVSIPHCSVHHPAINQAILEVQDWITSCRISPYDEDLSTGLLRYLQLTVDRKTSKVQLVLVINGSFSLQHEVLTEDLWKRRSDLWHSIWINENTQRSNTIFGSSWKLLFGERWLVETIHKKPLCLHPASFVQANLEMFERLLNHIADRILPNQDVLDFYAGTGVIGISLSDRCRSIICVEANALAKECFEETLKYLEPRLAERLSFVTAPSESCLHLLKERSVQTVIVDPPRKGLEISLLKALSTTKRIHELVYVSCGWTSFKRDCKLLLADGWLLREAEIFLFFPGSSHLEILAFFERKDG
jgi:23S rRNA (uracil-5-)-methyltransferase RumA